MENNYSFILEDNIARRRMVDKPLIDFFLLVFLACVGITTIMIAGVLMFSETERPYELFYGLLTNLLGAILSWYMISLQTNRVNAFIERKAEWYTKIVEFTNQYSGENTDLTKLNDLINPVIFNSRISLINLKNALVFLGIYTGFSSLTTIVGEEQEATLLLIYLFIIGVSVMGISIYEYPMNAIWNKIQCFENEFDETLSEVWIENGWIEKPMEFDIDPSKKRNYFLWFFYSIITLGIMMIIWKYKIYTAPDNMYYRFHEKEDKILDVIEKIEQQKRAEI